MQALDNFTPSSTTTTSSTPINPLARFVPLLAPAIIGVIALLIIFAMANAATETGPTPDEATKAMIQRRCAVPVTMMTTTIEDPYTGKPVDMLRATCAQPITPAIVNDGGN